MVLAECLLGTVGYQLKDVVVAVGFLCLRELCVVLVLVAHPYVGSPLLGLHMVLVAFNMGCTGLWYVGSIARCLWSW